MADFRRTQKQISERYKGALGYYRRIHAWRFLRFVASAIAIVGGIAGILFYQRRGPEKFFTVGPISAAHAGFGDDCGKCHSAANASREPLRPQQIAETLRDRFHRGIPLGNLDAKCETCHTSHTLHQPNVVENRSCAVCHQEHQGAASLKIVASSECAVCHNDANVMQASAQKGAGMPASAFHLRRLRATQFAFDMPRPPNGYTQTFASFWSGHPEFQLKRENARDPDGNILRFNHQRHFGADIPPLNGQKLTCISCHKPDEEGRYQTRITFAANCQACHSLQFDPNNPELTLPHGDPNAVRAFLQTLPTQYTQLAVKRGLTKPNELQSFVVQQLVRMRQAHRTPEDFEREVFFTTNPYKPQGTLQPRALFYGCAVCHEVKPNGASAPKITKPVTVQRWLPQARFNHAKHTSVDCITCHQATQSSETSDILMPAKASCVTCHSPQGKVVAECITCHTYHAPTQLAGNQPPNPLASLRQTVLNQVRN